VKVSISKKDGIKKRKCSFCDSGHVKKVYKGVYYCKSCRVYFRGKKYNFWRWQVRVSLANKVVV